MKIKIINVKKRKEMEQVNIDNNIFSEEEKEVAELLVELPRMILDLESPLLSSLLPFTWGCKKIRSAIQDTPSTTTTTCAAAPPAPPLCHGGAAVAPPCEAANSPATPLSLSLTECDDKAKKALRWKASLERKKEYYLKNIEDLTKSKASLNEEIENVKHYMEQLKAFNLKLKARKQELIYRYSSSNKSEAKKPNLGIGWPMQLVYAPLNSPKSMAKNHQNQQFQVSNSTQYVGLMLNQRCGPSQICNTEGIAQFQYVSGHHPTTSFPMPSLSSSTPNSSSNELGLVNNTSSNLGPIGILDLNVSSEEISHVESCQQLDVNVGKNKDSNREISGQARQRRIQIKMLKNPKGNSKTRYSYG